MKKHFLITLFIFSFSTFAQSKIMTRSGVIVFEASVPAFEEVKAKNQVVSCVLRPKTGEIACLALVKGFRFKVALMEEHFNENYAESDRFRKATFKGRLEGFDFKSISETAKEFVVSGQLEFHGKTNDVKTTAFVRKINEDIEILVNFSLLASDFDIKIPSLVKNKVTNKVNLKCEFLLK